MKSIQTGVLKRYSFLGMLWSMFFFGKGSSSKFCLLGPRNSMTVQLKALSHLRQKGTPLN